MDYFIIFFLVRKNYSSGNKDNLDLNIISYKEPISLDNETIEKIKCSLKNSSITDIKELKEELIGPRHGNPWITIVLIKVTNENEVENFTNDFTKFFNDLAKINEAPQKEANTEIENRKFYFVFIGKDDIIYNKSQKGMNNENILEASGTWNYNNYDGYSFTFKFCHPIKNADL